MCLLRNVVSLLLIATTAIGQNIRNKNVHCEEFNILDGGYFYDEYGRHISAVECIIRNYELSSERVYYLSNSEAIEILKITDSSMESLPVNLFYPLRNLKYLTVTNTTLKYVNSIPIDHLRLLDFSSNEIVSLQENAFFNCPELSKILLSNNKITILEGSLFSGVHQIVDLSNNVINNITMIVFDHPNIQILNLKKNSLEELDLNRFKTITGLRMLDLSYNKLKVLNVTENLLSSDFALNLISNQLTYLDLRNTSIKSLNIARNKVRYLAIGSKYKEIDAEDNEITEISFGDSIASLNILNLNNNKLGNNLQDICRCRNLTLLSLKSNNIDNIDSCFAYMSTLETLKLQNNNIYQVNHDSFFPDNVIQFLDLSFNRLEVVDEYTMSIFENLQFFYLNGNPLHDFNDSPESFMPKLVEVGLSHNRFKCSKLFLLLKKLKALNIKLHVDTTIPVNTTNIDGNACYQNHETELLKNSDNLENILAQKTNEKLAYFWEKINTLEGKVKDIAAMNFTLQEFTKSYVEQRKEIDVINKSLVEIKKSQEVLTEILSQRLGNLEEAFKNATEDRID
ncbi:toll-like receptor 6 [Phlebotomus papatasi]|uniref:toll-like receptor 6 n=1 Tax=Phlebotomus papatasi TaxID=29031 RepID=UPI0024835825|nr:toll-like receptor 6 [Phlebotomus papatasi]